MTDAGQERDAWSATSPGPSRRCRGLLLSQGAIEAAARSPARNCSAGRR